MASNHTLIIRALVLVILPLLILGSFVRLYQLAQYPSQLNRDEAALALNAKYIHESGVDEWGEKYPLQFKSFGDYKLPGYVYLLSSLFSFGINDTIVRLPAAVAGITLIVSIPLLFKVIAPFFYRKLSFLFVLFSVTLTPFAIFYSRMAWEANLSLALFVFSLCFLLRRKQNMLFDVFGIILYVLACLTYNSPLLLFPFILPVIPLQRGFREYKKWIFPFLAVLTVGICLFILFSQTAAQKSAITIFQDGKTLSEYPAYRAQFPSFTKTFFGNKYVYFAQLVLKNFIQTFSPYFLVTHGGSHPWHSILGRGHFYWTTYLFFLVGISTFFIRSLSLLKKGNTQKLRQLLQFALPIYLLIVSTLPAIVTTDAPHATRSLFTFVLILVISGCGAAVTAQKISEKNKILTAKNVILILSCFLFLEFRQYAYLYFEKWPPVFSSDFRVGLKEELQKIPSEDLENKVSIEDGTGFTYATVAWYQNIPAAEFLNTVHRLGPTTVNLYYVQKVGPYLFLENTDEVLDQPGTKLYYDKESYTWRSTK